MKAFSTTYVNEAHSRQETQRRQIEKTKGQKASGTKKKGASRKNSKDLVCAKDAGLGHVYAPIRHARWISCKIHLH